MAGGDSIQMLSFAVVLLSIIICSILVIILSKNPLQIGYLKSVLGTENTEEVEGEGEVEPEVTSEKITIKEESPVNIINKTDRTPEK